MPRTSAGLLPFRRREGRLEVFLVHPGGPFWANKDEHAWSVAKGEVEPGEDLLDAANREFHEETGLTLVGPTTPLAPVRQPSGKLVHAWAIETDIDPSTILEQLVPPGGPPRSGQVRQFRRLTALPGSTRRCSEQDHKGQVAILSKLHGGSAGEQRIRMHVMPPQPRPPC